MIRCLSLIIASLLLISCILPASLTTRLSPTSSPTFTPGPPAPLGVAYCKDRVCIYRVYAGVTDTNIIIRFDLVDPDGRVLFGESPSLNNKLLMKLTLKTASGEEIYLFGANIPKDEYYCYIGNDIPEYFGDLASACSIIIPRNITQKRLNPNDWITVELPQYNDLKQKVMIWDRIPITRPITPTPTPTVIDLYRFLMTPTPAPEDF